MSKISLARELAGPGASEEDIVRHVYALDKHEHLVFYGPDKPVPGFWQWVEQKTAEMDADDIEDDE